MDILDLVDTAAGAISDAEEEEEVLEDTLDPLGQKSLQDLVNENYKIVGTMNSLEQSSLVLGDLKLEHPQVIEFTIVNLLQPEYSDLYQEYPGILGSLRESPSQRTRGAQPPLPACRLPGIIHKYLLCFCDCCCQL